LLENLIFRTIEQ